MGVFKSKKNFQAPHSFMPYIAEDITHEMMDDGYDVKVEKLGNNGFDISISNTNLVKTVLGLKTALKILIKPITNGIHIEASVGIFGQQIIPTTIMFFLFWPVIVTQIWGIVKQSKLDDKIIQIASDCIMRHFASSNSGTKSDDDVFCIKCGKRHSANSKFCSECGEKLN